MKCFLTKFKCAIVLLLLTISFVACEKVEDVEPDPTAELEVTVRGTLSGNLRENISVGIYKSESDADSQSNAVKSNQTTDSHGIATFKDLEPNKRYWVRAAALLSKKIDQTGTLKEGSNEFEIRVL